MDRFMRVEFSEEPKMQCPKCGSECRADWVDVGFGPYSQQAGPFHCYTCNWTEIGCQAAECYKERCESWDYCQGAAMPQREGDK